MLVSPCFGQGNTDTKNFVVELLFELAQKEEESKGLRAQARALKIIVTAMLRNMTRNDQQRLIDQVEGALYEIKPDTNIPDDNTELLRDYVEKLSGHPRQ